MDDTPLHPPDPQAGTGPSPEQEIRQHRELAGGTIHVLPEEGTARHPFPGEPERIYQYHDLIRLQGFSPGETTPQVCLRSLDELLERDRQREQDGFPRKIRVGRLIRPGKGDQAKVVVVPTTVEEKFLHDDNPRPPKEGNPSGGSGEGQEGEILGEQPVRPEGPGGGTGAGQGEGGPHEIESSAYDLGRILTEKFELPNLLDKGKKRFLTRYTYDLTDKHRGFGQILDKKATLRRIIQTNIHLGQIKPPEPVEPENLVINPADKTFYILSREKDYESQAVVFFVRDYSGSMEGKATELVVSQHVMIYAWLLYQYSKQVQSRFILHDTEAREVPDFHTYYNFRVAGGTRVASGYRLVNEIVEKENLARDYNIYVFHGTDGDDWDTEGKDTIPELKRILAYASRMGVSVVSHTPGSKTEVEKYLQRSRLLDEQAKLLRLDVMREEADEPRLIEGIKKLIS